MTEFDILTSAAAGMAAERSALDLAARNVAAAQADGTAFVRLIPRFSVAEAPQDAVPGDAYDPPDDSTSASAGDDLGAAPVRYLGATQALGATPDAVSEMVAVLDAQRAYEANASVFDVGKRLAERTIDVGRLQ